MDEYVLLKVKKFNQREFQGKISFEKHIKVLDFFGEQESYV